MRKDDTDFLNKKYNVQLHHATLGDIGAGELNFGANRLAQVRATKRFSDDIVERKQIDLIKAITEDGKTFSLCTSRIESNALYPDYVIEGDVTASEFDTIKVQYSDVSEWFLHYQNISGTVGEALTWTYTPQAIHTVIKTKEDHFELRSECITSRQSLGENLILHEHVEFVFSAKGRRFSAADIRTKTHEFSCLLSILLAYPATIAKVMVTQGEMDLAYRVHFPSYERPAREMDDNFFWTRYLIQQPALEGRWQSILEAYSLSKFRKICWTRLAGMQRYEGFLEFKTLGYVSLLDSYLSIRFSAKKLLAPKPPSKKKLANFRAQLGEELPSLTEEVREQIIILASRSFATPNADFAKRFELAIQETDADIAKIINLSKSDFIFIKRVRDKVAHGDAPNLQSDNLTPVIQIEGKITLLLTYWAFLDVGLTTQDFIKCLNRTSSTLRRHSALNEVHLSRVTGTAKFFSVTREKFQKLQKIENLKIFGCCLEDEHGELNYSEEYTQAYRRWRNDKTNLGECNAERIFGIANDKATLVLTGYFDCGENHFPVLNMWIIKNNT